MNGCIDYLFLYERLSSQVPCGGSVLLHKILHVGDVPNQCFTLFETEYAQPVHVVAWWDESISEVGMVRIGQMNVCIRQGHCRIFDVTSVAVWRTSTSTST
jgi:hypothetical protein